ncbi:hypothetical protein Herbaro_16450 [Herbaspirillum sp. WKF16]|jgi:hypothetical protein|uniref:hypothetical protein n=1 Tax=Herbaspirillum sp. WKF16 TaxID=3028312 RepID=UPI0023A9532D|nr:hypothetical protein [Herbaspirillum sp. WKF16]WDZ95066.1 hypothetical protein Herbaro_16450 [Herbaspirillum sp. WKF16]
MSRKIITAALLASAAFAGAAYAQSYDQGGAAYQTQQQYDSSAQTQYYNYQGDQTTPPSYSQEQGYNGQYVDHRASEMRANQPDVYARDLKDGPMGTSPGS